MRPRVKIYQENERRQAMCLPRPHTLLQRHTYLQIWSLIFGTLRQLYGNVFLSPVYTIQPVIKTGCRTSLTTGCIVYTNIQPVVIPVWQPVWQPSVSCIQPAVKTVVQPGLTTGWTNSGCSYNRLMSNRLQPVWQPVWQPVECLFTRYARWQPIWQLAVSCKRGVTITLFQPLRK